MVYDLRKAGLNCKTQLPVAIEYETLVLKDAFKLDILVDDKVIIETKNVEKLHESADAQLLSHLIMTGKRLGFLVNFKVRFISQGITRFIK